MSINNNVNESDDDIFFLFNDKKEKKNEKKIIQNIRTDKNNNFNKTKIRARKRKK